MHIRVSHPVMSTRLVSINMSPVEFNFFLNIQKGKKNMHNSWVTRDMEINIMIFVSNYRRLSTFLLFSLNLLNIVAIIYCTRGKVILFLDPNYLKNRMTILVSILSDFLLVIVNIFLAWRFMSSNLLLQMVTFLDLESDNITPRNHFTENFIKWLKQMLRFIPLVPIIIEIYTFSNKLGWNAYQYFCMRHVWFFIMHTMMIAYIRTAIKIRVSFSTLNNHLDLLSNSSQETSIALIDQRKFHNIQAITSRYHNLCNILDKFNQFSKASLVVSMMCITINLLYNFTIIMLYAVKEDGIVGEGVKTSYLATQPLFALISVGQAAAAAFAGESLEEEGERTSRICCIFLNNLNRILRSDKDQLMEKELKFLLDQSKSRKICLHAGGFFKLNWGILSSITSTVTTYAIVIIQFLPK